MQFNQRLREWERGQLTRALQTVADRSANVVFYGFGGVAEEAIKCLIDSNEDFRPRIGTILVALRNIDEEASRFFDECNTKTLETGIRLEYHLIPSGRGKPRQELAEAVRKADVFFLTLQAELPDAGEFHGAALRDQQTAVNLPAVRNTVQLLEDVFPHTWITVSNQPEILNYAIALELIRQGRSECIERLVGFSQPDKVRLDTLIREALIDKGKLPHDTRVLSTSAYTVGHHNDPLPIVDVVTVSYLTKDRESGIRLERMVTTFSPEEQLQLYDALRVWPGDSSRLSRAAGRKGPRSPTQESTAAAIRDCVEAVLGERRMVNASVPYATAKGTQFVQLPVVFSGGKPLIYNPGDKSLVPEQHRRAFDNRIETLAAATHQLQVQGALRKSVLQNVGTMSEFDHHKSRGSPIEKEHIPNHRFGELELCAVGHEEFFLWKPQRGESPVLRGALPEHTMYAQAYAGTFVFGTSTGTLYRLERGGTVSLMDSPKREIAILAAAGQYLMIGVKNSTGILLWDGREWVSQEVEVGGAPTALQLDTRNGESVLYVGGKGTILALSLISGEAKQRYRGARGWISSIAFDADHVLAATTAGSLYRWNHNSGETPDRFSKPPHREALRIAQPWNDQTGVCYTEQGALFHYNDDRLVSGGHVPTAPVHHLGGIVPGENAIFAAATGKGVLLFDQFFRYNPMLLTPEVPIRTVMAREVSHVV